MTTNTSNHINKQFYKQVEISKQAFDVFENHCLVLVNANAHGMLEGFTMLKQLVGLMQIPMTIPVSLYLVFEAE